MGIRRSIAATKTSVKQGKPTLADIAAMSWLDGHAALSEHYNFTHKSKRR